MQQYLNLLKEIKEKGTWKEPAREGMPRTLSLFGTQFRHNLQDGFPLLTTKKLSFKNIVVELLYFLRGDTNIKYLVDNGCNIWNEDAYNYYVKLMKKEYTDKPHLIHTFERFLIYVVNEIPCNQLDNYKYGDCGKQYGWLWRRWEALIDDGMGNSYPLGENNCGYIDQIKVLIEGLNKNPMSRRHILTAWNPATLDDMALNACHAFVQFNCRPIQKGTHINGKYYPKNESSQNYFLDCHLYQRSADVFLGVPYNIASYALLTEILCKICNMIPGEFVHTFGDVHIYENHMEAVNEQLSRNPEKLPKLVHGKTDVFWNGFTIDQFTQIDPIDFWVEGYKPQARIKAKLSTGLK